MTILRIIGLATLAAVLSPGPSLAQDSKTKPPQVRRVVPLSADSSAQLAGRVLAHPDLPQRERGHRLAAIRVTAEEAASVGVTVAGATPASVVTVVLFDHTALEARRVVMDPATNNLLLNEVLPGRPQRSNQELAEAASIVQRDPALARLLGDGGVLDGGFVIDDPHGSRRRMIQLKLISSDRRTPLRTIVVDLTRGEIASASNANRGR